MTDFGGGGSHDSEETEVAWIEGVAILAAVVLVVFVIAFNDWQKERQFRGLQNKIESEHKFQVIRNKQSQEIAVGDILVGDICQIKYGKTIGIFIFGISFRKDNTFDGVLLMTLSKTL